MGNKEIAETLMDSNDRLDDKIKVTPQDVAQQKQQMKKAGTLPTGKKRGRPPGSAQPKQPATLAPATSASASPVDLIDKTIDLAQQCGGVAALKKLVDRLADMGNR